MAGTDSGGQTAPGCELPGHFHHFGFEYLNQIVEDAVGDVFIKHAHIAILKQVICRAGLCNGIRWGRAHRLQRSPASPRCSGWCDRKISSGISSGAPIGSCRPLLKDSAKRVKRSALPEPTHGVSFLNPTALHAVKLSYHVPIQQGPVLNFLDPKTVWQPWQGQGATPFRDSCKE